MDLVHLRYFRAIAELGSLTAAARSLGVAQSTLTAAVQRLEEELETQLLVRSSRGVSLTPTGGILAGAASEVKALIERTEDRIRGLEHEDRGRFVIGCHESLGAYFLPGFLSSFLPAHPGIEIDVWNASSAQVREALVAREIHFGLIVEPEDHDDLVVLDAFRDAVALVGRRDGLAAPGKRKPAEERLRSHPLIYAGRVDQCAQIVEALAAEELFPKRHLKTGDLELTKSLVLAGVGIGILPRRVAAYGHEGELAIVHPDLPQVPDRVALAYRGDSHKTAAWRRTKDALMDHSERIKEIPLG